MRSEKEMLDLIVDTARQDDRIRAVLLNGSRADPGAARDFFQDFDILYLVTDLEPYRHNLEWIRRFGDLMVMQMPDEMADPPPGAEFPGFTYLMQFKDGNRIDLCIFPLSRQEEIIGKDLGILLLDKDGMVDETRFLDAGEYLPKPPTRKAFDDCCNEFWWVCPYVAKGLWRQEFPYARFMLDQVVREQLMKMLHWYISVQNGFSAGPGKFGKYTRKYLEPDLYRQLLQTYSDGSDDNTWKALHSMCDLFRRTARQVADQSGYDYPEACDRQVSAHLQHVQHLPRDAREMY
jgi:aminoglycoside 6-adenylyltransferase